MHLLLAFVVLGLVLMSEGCVVGQWRGAAFANMGCPRLITMHGWPVVAATMSRAFAVAAKPIAGARAGVRQLQLANAPEGWWLQV